MGRAAGRRRSARRVVERALKLALPLTLALQWGLRSRYLGRPKGLLEFARHRRAIALGAVRDRRRCPRSRSGESGALAGLLTLTWTAGTVLIRRGWYAVYGLIVAGRDAGHARCWRRCPCWPRPPR